MRITVRHEDGYAAVDVGGSIDLSSSPELRKACLGLVRKREDKVIINLSDVNYIDSSGIATLVECLKGLADYEGRLALVGLGERARDVFDVTNLAAIFQFFETEEVAAREMK